MISIIDCFQILLSTMKDLTWIHFSKPKHRAMYDCGTDQQMITYSRVMNICMKNTFSGKEEISVKVMTELMAVNGSLLILRLKEIPSWWYHELLWDRSVVRIKTSSILKGIWIWRGDIFFPVEWHHYELSTLSTFVSWNHITKSLLELGLGRSFH